MLDHVKSHILMVLPGVVQGLPRFYHVFTKVYRPGFSQTLLRFSTLQIFFGPRTRALWKSSFLIDRMRTCDSPKRRWDGIYTLRRIDTLQQYTLARVIELDYGKILTGKPDIYLMVKTHGFPVKIFPNKPIQWTRGGILFLSSMSCIRSTRHLLFQHSLVRVRRAIELRMLWKPDLRNPNHQIAIKHGDCFGSNNSPHFYGNSQWLIYLFIFFFLGCPSMI